MGCVTCFGNDPEEFYNQLLAGKSGIKKITKFNVEGYPTNFAGEISSFDSEGLIDRKSLRRYDDCIKYTMVAGKKALAMAGLHKEANADAFEALQKQRCGVLVGSGMGGLTVFAEACTYAPPPNSRTGVEAINSKGYRKMSPFFIPYAITNMGSALLATEQGFMGPNYSISTACATANYAYVAAANHIRSGEADLIVTGGSEAPVLPVGLGGFIACRALSSRNHEPEKASRPWDAGRDGFVMGEGAGILVFESLEHAQARGAPILAEYLGGSTSCDAYHMTDPRPDGSGVQACISKALADAKVDRDAINYINAHATSTLVGDIAEIKALKGAFSEEHLKRVAMNGTKSLIGHSLGAAAGLESIAVIQAIRTGWLHPTLNQEDPIPEVDGLNTVANVKQEFQVTAAISNSFGFGGHNSAVIFAPFRE